MEYAIEVTDVKKVYPLYRKKNDKIREALSLVGKQYHTDFEALKGISFRIPKGDCVGIIGLNGSGKSTLLKILTGIVKATSGDVKTSGKVAALLELGAGFNPGYTGIENIYLNMLLMGFTREETNKKLPEILEFADIGNFVYQPVKHYSSGMFVRLAFAVAVTADPDILIIDEALSVGDIFFQQKCYNKIRELAQKATVLIVSHDLNAITKFCNRIIVMNQGELFFDGDAREAVTEYYKIKQGSIVDEDIKAKTEQENLNAGYEIYRLPDPTQYSGKMNIVIDRYYYQIDEQPFGEYCEAGKNIYVRMLLNSAATYKNLIIGYQVRDKYGNEVFGETSLTSSITNNRSIYAGKNLISFQFEWPEVREGDYFITLGVGLGDEVLNQEEQCWINQAIHIVNSTHNKLIYGVFNNPMTKFSIRRETNV